MHQDIGEGGRGGLWQLRFASPVPSRAVATVMTLSICHFLVYRSPFDQWLHFRVGERSKPPSLTVIVLE